MNNGLPMILSFAMDSSMIIKSHSNQIWKETPVAILYYNVTSKNSACRNFMTSKLYQSIFSLYLYIKISGERKIAGWTNRLFHFSLKFLHIFIKTSINFFRFFESSWRWKYTSFIMYVKYHLRNIKTYNF